MAKKSKKTVYQVKCSAGWLYHEENGGIDFCSGPAAASAEQFKSKKKAEKLARFYHGTVVEREPFE